MKRYAATAAVWNHCVAKTSQEVVYPNEHEPTGLGWSLEHVTCVTLDACRVLYTWTWSWTA